MKNAYSDEALQSYPFAELSLPKNWMQVTLADISVDISPGFASGKHSSDGSGIPHLRPMNVDREGQIDLSVVKSVTETNGVELKDGDILFNNTNSAELIGKTAVISPSEEGYAFSNHMTRVRPEIGVDPVFLARQLHFLWMSGYMKHRCTNHVNQASISSKTLANTIPFLLAPSSEQARIVAKLEDLLSDLDTGVAELKTAQKRLEQYRQSLLKVAVDGKLTAKWRRHNPLIETGTQLLMRVLTTRRARWEAKQLTQFSKQGKKPPKDWEKKYPEPVEPDTSNFPNLPEGWGVASIGQIASDEKHSLAIGAFGSNLKVSDYRESGVPLVFVRNIRSGIYGGVSTKYVTSDKAQELAAHSIEAGDVLITKMGDPPGDADIYPINQPTAIITADCIKVRCCEELIRPDYLKTVINSFVGQQQIKPMTQGVAQKKVSLGRFTSLSVPLPSLEEQEHLMALVSEAQKEAVALEEAIIHSIKQSAAQRKAILMAAFSGQLVPQDPNDEPAHVLLARIRVEKAEREKQPKPLRKIKGNPLVKKNTKTIVHEWIKSQDDKAFTFDQINESFTLEYESLKESIFELLEEEPPLIEQVFDETYGRIVFKRKTL